MRNLKISLCQHPTTVVFVDDNIDYLKHLFTCYNEVLPCLTFDNSREALYFLNENYNHTSFISRNMVHPEDGELNKLSSNIDIANLRNEVLLSERFEEIAVLVIDYTMPAINGIELCKLIKNPNIRVILLTGDADYDIAIKEFNNGNIDKYFKKTTPNLMDELLQAIYDLEKQYFIEQTNIILANSSNQSFDFLEDPEVARVFDKVCYDNNIVEYYLLNDKGGFLLVDRQAVPSWFCVIEESELLNNFYNTAVNCPAPDTILNALKSKTQIPFFYTDADTKISPSNWDNYLYPATQLKSDKTYYYSYIKQLKARDNQPLQTLSYTDYLAKF